MTFLQRFLFDDSRRDVSGAIGCLDGQVSSWPNSSARVFEIDFTFPGNTDVLPVDTDAEHQRGIVCKTFDPAGMDLRIIRVYRQDRSGTITENLFSRAKFFPANVNDFNFNYIRVLKTSIKI